MVIKLVREGVEIFSPVASGSVLGYVVGAKHRTEGVRCNLVVVPTRTLMQLEEMVFDWYHNDITL